MKVKVESVTVGKFGYDSIQITVDKNKTSIAFDKKDNIVKYDGKYVDIEQTDGTYTIKESVNAEKK